MSIKFSTIPQKRLLAGITSASTEFYINNILSFDGENNVIPSDLGTQHYCAFRNDTGTILELMEIDPSTISSGPITILRRGLSFYGDLTTENTDLKLDWPANSIVMLGTDVPQILQWLKEYVDNALIAGGVPASTSAAGIVVEASLAEIQAGTATKTISSVVYKLFAPLDKLKTYITTLFASETVAGIVEEATDAEVTAGTATGATGAKLFVTPAKLKTKLNNLTIFGSDYSDGNVTISVNTSLSRDMYYDTLTINNGVTLSPNGYRIFAKNVINNGSISVAGGNGGNATGQTGGAAGAAGGGNGSMPAGRAGQIGGTGATGPGAGGAGVAGTASTYSLNNQNGVAGGNGGNGGYGSGAGGTGGAVSSTPYSIPRNIVQSYYLFDLGAYNGTTVLRYNVTAGSGSGGGGAAYNTSLGGGGGGSGGSGGSMFIACESLTNAGTITAKGGNGGQGGNHGGAGNNGSVGGGGGGGNGGAIFLIYTSLVNTGSITVAGGTGGAIGAVGDTVAATAGATGATGLLVQITN
jgi:hypothetical protein